MLLSRPSHLCLQHRAWPETDVGSAPRCVVLGKLLDLPGLPFCFLSSFPFKFYFSIRADIQRCLMFVSGVRPWWLDVSVIYDAVSFVLFPLPGEAVARFAWKRGCEAEHTARGAGLLRYLSSAPPGGRGKVGVEGFFLGRLLARLTGEELSKKLRGKKKPADFLGFPRKSPSAFCGCRPTSRGQAGTCDELAHPRVYPSSVS